MSELHEAAERGDLGEVKRLLGEGHGLDVFDDLSFTPLHYAARENHVEVCEYLIVAGADVNAHDESKIGETPLGEIAQTCTLAMATLLVRAGANPTIPGWMQLTALDRAAKRKRGEGVAVHELLLAVARSKYNYPGTAGNK